MDDNIPRIAVIGDEKDQLYPFLQNSGHRVDSYQSDETIRCIQNIQKYRVIVINHITDNSDVNNLLLLAGLYTTGVVFLGPAIKILSNRIHDPGNVYTKQQYNPIRIKVLQRHPIFGSYLENTTLIPTQSSSYYYYDKLHYGQSIAEHFGEHVIGISESSIYQARYVMLGILDGDCNNWNHSGRVIFLNSVIWASEKPS